MHVVWWINWSRAPIRCTTARFGSNAHIVWYVYSLLLSNTCEQSPTTTAAAVARVVIIILPVEMLVCACSKYETMQAGRHLLPSVRCSTSIFIRICDGCELKIMLSIAVAPAEV